MTSETSPEHFYDGLASDYHRLFEDWWGSVERQSAVLERLLTAASVAPPSSVLDCACGIGTQLLGLAARGYAMTGADISHAAVARARLEAEARGFAVELVRDDMRELERVERRTFDAVICCDNALPHLLTDADLDAALTAMHARLEPGGVLLVSVRDYDDLAAQRPASTPPRRVTHTVDGHLEAWVTFQLWDWRPDASAYDLDLFVMRQRDDGPWEVSQHRSTYRALKRAALLTAIERAGFRLKGEGLGYLDAGASGYYQPVVVARRVS